MSFKYPENCPICGKDCKMVKVTIGSRHISYEYECIAKKTEGKTLHLYDENGDFIENFKYTILEE